MLSQTASLASLIVTIVTPSAYPSAYPSPSPSAYLQPLQAPNPSSPADPLLNPVPAPAAPTSDPLLNPVPAPSPQPTVPATPQPVTQPITLEIRLSRRRVFVYRQGKVVKSYPVAVGRPGWETPKGTFRVLDKQKNPTWIHPLTGAVVPAGDPENPLGRHWIGFWTNGRNWIGFHGTPTPKSVGRAVSHGCIRMYNKDIQELFALVPVGTVVKVVK